MLLNLPNEVILPISSYLSLRDKVTLITTCRRLHDLISNTNLYQDLDLLHHKRHIEDIIQKFESNQYNGTQVKTLQIHMDALSAEQYSKIATIFPNITRCNSSMRASTRKGDDDPIKVKWKDTLERYSIYDRHGAYFSHFLHQLNTYEFMRITVLELGCEKYSPKFGYRKNYEFLDIVRSTPSLKMLTLRRCDINLIFLDSLELNCPKVESIVLADAVIQIEEKESYSPQLNRPAESVLILVIDDCVILDKDAKLLDYIPEKYTNLHTLHLSLYVDYDFEKKIEYFHSVIDKYTWCYYDYSEEDIQESIETFDILYAEYTSTMDQYKSAVVDEFITNLPKTLKVLKLENLHFGNIMDSLLLSEANPTTIDLKTNDTCPPDIFERPDQYENLKQFTHLKTLITPIYNYISYMSEFHEDVASTSITRLEIEIDAGNFPISWLLSKFPSLQELSMHPLCAHFDEKEDDTIINQNLRLLSVKSRLIHQGFINLVTKMAPNLERVLLTIKEYYPKTPEISTIDLTQCRLEHCSISFDFEGLSGGYVIYDIQKTKQQLVFKADDEYHATLSHSYPLEDISDVYRVNIACDDMHGLWVEGYNLKRDLEKIIVCE